MIDEHRRELLELAHPSARELPRNPTERNAYGIADVLLCALTEPGGWESPGLDALGLIVVEFKVVVDLMRMADGDDCYLKIPELADLLDGFRRRLAVSLELLERENGVRPRLQPEPPTPADQS